MSFLSPQKEYDVMRRFMFTLLVVAIAFAALSPLTSKPTKAAEVDYDWWSNVMTLYLSTSDQEAIIVTEGAAVGGMLGAYCGLSGPFVGLCAAMVGGLEYWILQYAEGYEASCEPLILGITWGYVWVIGCGPIWGGEGPNTDGGGGGGGGSRGFGFSVPSYHAHA
jgi:hypothetical protein